MSLLMIAHPRGPLYITNDTDVAGTLQVAEEIRHRGAAFASGSPETEIGPSVREKMILDFGGSTIVGWEREEVVLMDGSEFLFWPHQFSGVLEEVQRAYQEAAQQGYGILQDEVFPVAMSFADLSFLLDWLRLNEEEYRSKEAEHQEQFRQGYDLLLAREGYMLHHVNHVPCPGVQVMVPGPLEVQ